MIAYLTRGVAYLRSLQVGAGSQTSVPAGAVHVTTTTAATAADQVLTTLATYTFPASSLTKDGDTIRVTAWGDLGATANTKNLFITLGNDTILSRASAGNNVGFWMQAIAVRISATQYDYMGVSMVNGETTFATKTTQAANETWTDSRAIAFKGQNGTAAANDIVFHGMLVEVIPAP
jgi:hypothetical protein